MKLSLLMHERLFFCLWLVGRGVGGEQENKHSAHSMMAPSVKRQRKQIRTAHRIYFPHLTRGPLFLVYESYHMAFHLHSLSSFFPKGKG